MCLYSHPNVTGYEIKRFYKVNIWEYLETKKMLANLQTLDSFNMILVYVI